MRASGGARIDPVNGGGDERVGLGRPNPRDQKVLQELDAPPMIWRLRQLLIESGERSRVAEKIAQVDGRVGQFVHGMTEKSCGPNRREQGKRHGVVLSMRMVA
jgi:hypothetical protein